MQHAILTPAYGRDYKSKRAIAADLNSGSDFVLQPQGCYANDESLADMDCTAVNVRYKSMRSVAVLTLSGGVWK